MKCFWVFLCIVITNFCLAQAPKNIIMIVSDGMGYAMPAAYRHYNKPVNDALKSTVFDRNLIGSSSTHPAETSGLITDSAASATALASGVKTYNSAIGLDVNKQPVETVLERAKKNNKLVAIISTSQINHATPASYMSHNISRNNYNEIADSYFDDKINNNFKADVMLGGGTTYFIRKDRNLVKEFTQNNYQYINDFSQLKSLDNNKGVLGLFAKEGLKKHIDSAQKNRLKTMLSATLTYFEKHKSNKNGYFILLEASQIDWAGHSNDVATAFSELEEFADTLLFLEEYVNENKDTLVISTSDHETGGFSIGADDQYKWDAKIVKNINSSPQRIAKYLLKHGYDQNYLNNELKFTLTEFESLQVKNLLNEPDYGEFSQGNKELLTDLLINIVNKKTFSGWTTKGHTGVDVPVYAMGKQKELFRGHQDNTDIAKKIFSLLSNNKKI